MTYKITNRQQAQFDELRAFHFYDCPTIDWKALAREPFPQNGQGPNEMYWIEKEQRYSPSKLSQIFGVSKLIFKYYNYKRNKGRASDKISYSNWQKEYPFYKEVLEGNEESWRKVIREHANFHNNLYVAKAYSIFAHDLNTIECDIYLNSIEKSIPNRIEKITKRGHIRYHSMPKTKRFELYEAYVYSCSNKVINDLFAVLPCQTIFLNGLNGNLDDHVPILSVVVERKNHLQERCPIKTIKKHRTIEDFKKRSGFKTLERVYSPITLFGKEC